MILHTETRQKYLLALVTTKDATLENADAFKEEMLKLIDDGHKKIVLNFEQVGYMDSSFLGAMVAALKHALTNQAELYLTCLQKDIANMLQLIRMDKVFKIRNRPEDIQ